jgi:hypothetical protein
MERFFFFEVVKSSVGLLGLRFPLPRDRKVIVGRSETADIQLPGKTISRRHIEVEVVGDAVQVRDLDSLNGSGVGFLLQRGFTAVLQPEDELIANVGGIGTEGLRDPVSVLAPME